MNDSYPKKYLIIDNGGVLDGFMTYDKPGKDDLILSNIGGGCYQVLKNGVLLMVNLDLLVTYYGYEILFHSKNKESDQLKLLMTIKKACSHLKITCPKIKAIAVRDPERFKGVDSNSPVIIKDSNHEILIAGYDLELDGKACVRNALSKLMFIPKDCYKDHIIFDDGESVIAQAKTEGWTTKLISQLMYNNLEEAIREIYYIELLKERESQQNIVVSKTFVFGCTESFIALNKNIEMGKSASKDIYQCVNTDKQYIGKCSLASFGGLHIDEYRELTAIKLYELLGVPTSTTFLSMQIVSNQTLALYKYSSYPDIESPKLHLMTEINNSQPIDKNFIHSYLKSQAKHKERPFIIDSLPLKGFGKALALNILIYGKFWQKNSGRNMNYIRNDFSYQIIITNSEEALSPSSNEPNVKLENEAEDSSKSLVFVYDDYKLSFNDLNLYDQIEFALEVEKIPNISDDIIREIFKPVIRLGDLKDILNDLLVRKKKFTEFLSHDVTQKILKRILELEQFVESRSNLYSSLQDVVCKFQLPERNLNYIGKSQELDIIKESIVRYNTIGLVGPSGYGKTQLAIEYIYSANYKNSVWFTAHQVSTQMSKYLEDVKKIKVTCKTIDELVTLFYQNLEKGTCIVFDNAISEKLLSPYLPLSKDFHILITTRNEDWTIPIMKIEIFK